MSPQSRSLEGRDGRGQSTAVTQERRRRWRPITNSITGSSTCAGARTCSAPAGTTADMLIAYLTQRGAECDGRYGDRGPRADCDGQRLQRAGQPGQRRHAQPRGADGHGQELHGHGLGRRSGRSSTSGSPTTRLASDPLVCWFDYALAGDVGEWGDVQRALQLGGRRGQRDAVHGDVMDVARRRATPRRTPRGSRPAARTRATGARPRWTRRGWRRRRAARRGCRCARCAGASTTRSPSCRRRCPRRGSGSRCRRKSSPRRASRMGLARRGDVGHGRGHRRRGSGGVAHGQCRHGRRRRRAAATGAS